MTAHDVSFSIGARLRPGSTRRARALSRQVADEFNRSGIGVLLQDFQSHQPRHGKLVRCERAASAEESFRF